MDKPKVVIRVDGSTEIGLGHISRCCALAEMLKNDFEIVFYTRADSKVIIEDIKNYCVGVIQLNNNITYEAEAVQWIEALTGNEIVVLDGYNFNTDYQQKIKDKGCKIVCIDDIHAYHFVADVVINHAPGIAAEAYSTEPYTRLYLGPDYVMLKKLFLDEALIPEKNQDLKGSSILICLGGADPNNETKNTLEELLMLFPERFFHVVVGAAYRHLQQLQKLVDDNKQVLLYIGVKPEKMLSLMQQSHIAVTSASTIALEYLCVKGSLFLKCIADNQEEVYQSLIAKKCAYAFESIKENYYSNIAISNQHKLIDGKSNERLLYVFTQLHEKIYN